MTDDTSYDSTMARSKRPNPTVPMLADLRSRARAARSRIPGPTRRLPADNLGRLDEADLEARLREAYTLLSTDDRRLNRDFQHVDAEGWG